MANMITSISLDHGEVTVELDPGFDYTDAAALSNVRAIVDSFQSFNAEAA
jgi:hypothetical protein